jgi:hypothetical protein
MTSKDSVGLEDMQFDGTNLYREERLTDLKVGSIRRMVPVKVDGTDDPDRKAVFAGQTQLMTQMGPVPVEFAIEVETLEEAVNAFPECVKKAVEQMVEEAREYQRREASRIVVPGQEGPPMGGMPGMPGGNRGGSGGAGGGGLIF